MCILTGKVGNAVAAIAALQWGRTRSGAEIGLDELDLSISVKLQWGRTRSSAEMAVSAPSLARLSAASMGPHSFECGNDRAARAPRCGFTKLQWGRTRSSAEISPLAQFLEL